jgi:Zn-dependent protease with chaperone function
MTPDTQSTPPPLSSTSLTKEGIVLQKEKTYYAVLMTISVIGWIILTISVVGLIYALIGALVAWFVSGLLSARLKSESVEVTKDQLPVLYKSFEEVCEKLDLSERPRFYILQHNGVLNAFASRHSGRNFIVVFSDLLEALGHDSDRMKFLIGHEVGHIRRNHILKRIFLLPSMIIPMVGHAYHRACEATCDRFGLFAAGNSEAATQGLVVLAAGKQVSAMANPAAFARQYYDNRGFFISWHELSSGYPTLSQRVAKMLGIDIPFFSRKASRNPLAYLFSFVFSIQILVIAYLAFFVGLTYMNASKAKQSAAHARASSSRTTP